MGVVLTHCITDDTGALTMGLIRTDIPEQQLFTSVAIAMLAVAERYAQGIVWADDHKEDHTQELEFLKGMLLTWCRTPENLGKQ